MDKRSTNTPDALSNSAIRLLPENDIHFDVKGNAVYQGPYQHLLDNPLMEQALNLESDSWSEALIPLGKAVRTHITPNSGYNPYHHEAQGNTTRTKKPDLRELSKWIEMKKRLATQGK